MPRQALGRPSIKDVSAGRHSALHQARRRNPINLRLANLKEHYPPSPHRPPSHLVCEPQCGASHLPYTAAEQQLSGSGLLQRKACGCHQSRGARQPWRASETKLAYLRPYVCSIIFEHYFLRHLNMFGRRRRLPSTPHLVLCIHRHTPFTGKGLA